MSKQNESDQLDDDSLAYAQAQTGVQAEDPLVAIKNMRLEQLAQCRLKSAEEMQTMREKLRNKAKHEDADKV